MRIYYHLSDYISHRRAGQAYMACLRQLGHELTDDPACCDVAVIHAEPHYYPGILRSLSLRPGTRRAGYAVWETPQLPDAFLPGLGLMNAVWTCSEFSRRAFAPSPTRKSTRSASPRRAISLRAFARESSEMSVSCARAHRPDWSKNAPSLP